MKTKKTCQLASVSRLLLAAAKLYSHLRVILLHHGALLPIHILLPSCNCTLTSPGFVLDSATDINPQASLCTQETASRNGTYISAVNTNLVRH